MRSTASHHARLPRPRLEVQQPGDKPQLRGHDPYHTLEQVEPQQRRLPLPVEAKDCFKL